MVKLRKKDICSKRRKSAYIKQRVQELSATYSIDYIAETLNITEQRCLEILLKYKYDLYKPYELKK